MRYINPYDISDYFGTVNLENFKKFKKRILNELELEDNEIEIKNQKFSKDEIYTILETIDENRELLKNYFIIYRKQDINNFLYGIRKDVYIIAQIQSLDEEIKKFITPYLIDKLKIMYKNAFLNKNINFLKTSPPVPQRYYEEIYESVYKILKNKENEIKNKKGNKVDFNEIKEIVGDVDLLNSLPDYFSKNRNDIALGVRDLAIDAYNEFNDIELSQKLLDFALSLEVNSKNKDMFLKDKKDLEEIEKNLKIVKQKEKKEKELNNFIDSITDILYTSQKFSFKLRKINSLMKNSQITEEKALLAFNTVFEYINKKTDRFEKTVFSSFPKPEAQHIQDIKYIQEGARELQNFLEILQMKVNDYKFLQVIENNLKDIKKLAFNTSGLCKFLMIFGPFGLIICAILGLFI